MASKKISELTAAGALTGAELVELVQGGLNVQSTTQDIANLGGGGAGTITSVNGDSGPSVTLTANEIGSTPAGGIAATNVQAAIDELDTEKANLASPTFTGTPSLPTGATAVTQSAGDDSTKIATTAFVKTALLGSKSMIIAVTDEVTNIGTGTAKVSFRMPYAMTLTSVRASLVVAQASGTIFTVDINEEGTTILSTKLTIDNTELTSVSAATAAVISDASLADDALITVDVDQIGNGSAIGLKITLIGT